MTATGDAQNSDQIQMDLPPPEGAYYELVEPWDDLPQGALCYVWVDGEGQLRACHLDQNYILDHEDLGRFRVCPDGGLRRRQQMLELQQEILTHQPAALTATTLELPAPAGAAEAPPGTELILLGRESRNELVERRRAAVQAHKHAQNLQGKMQGLLAEQQAVMEVMAKKWGAELERLQYMIDTINLYLGREEEITPIQEGQKAAADEPICIRQTVLYMDEECALLSDEGGIDFASLADFDKWLCEPSHLSRILPEAKGIIALKLRRGDKFYADVDVWTQMQLLALNKQTYILIRNGDCLWRIWNEIEPGEHLIPTRREFEELFLDSWNQEPLRPGTARYQKVLHQATGRTKQYLQIILMLQGIIDRTRIFRPARAERINLLDPNPDAGTLRLIRDAEMALGFGRPGFRKWRESLNQRLDCGKRVIFGGTGYLRSRYEDRESRSSLRVRPNAPWPDHDHVYVLNPAGDLKDRGSYLINYSWMDDVRGRPRHGNFKAYRSDPFLLNFDDASLEDMEFYFNDRQARQHYLEAIPLLRAAIRLKREEIEKERPFIDLLGRRAVEQLGLDPTEAAAYLAEVVPWWKQRTRHATNLTANEQAAYRQILNEIALRRKIDRNPADVRTAERLQKLIPDWLAIAKDTGRTVVCVRRRPDCAGYVRLETWDAAEERLIREEPLHFLGPDCLRWRLLAVQPEWHQWPKDARRERFLTPDESSRLLEQIRLTCATAPAGNKSRFGNEDFLHFCALTFDEDFFYLYGTKPPDWGWGERRADIRWVTERVPWFRKNRHAEAEVAFRYPHVSTLDGQILSLPETRTSNAEPTKKEERNQFASSWDLERRRHLSEAMRGLPFTAWGKRISFFDEAAFGKARAAIQKQTHRQQQASRRCQNIRAAVDSVAATLERQFWELQRRKYLADGGDAELWADEKKTIKLRIPSVRETELEDCVSRLIEAGEDLDELTIQQLWERARQLGWKEKRPEHNRLLPLQLKIKPSDVEG